MHKANKTHLTICQSSFIQEENNATLCYNWTNYTLLRPASCHLRVNNSTIRNTQIVTIVHFTLRRIDRSCEKIYACEANHVQKHHFGTLERKAKSLQENEIVRLITEKLWNAIDSKLLGLNVFAVQSYSKVHVHIQILKFAAFPLTLQCRERYCT